MHLPYPKGIDLDRILKSLTIVVIEKVPGGARDIPVIGVHSKGKVAAEFVSIARYAMFSQGYWHHAVRSMKAMLARAVQSLIALATDEERNRFQSAFITFVMSIPESLYHRGPSQMTLLDTSPSSKSEPKQEGGAAVVPQLALTDVATLKWLQQQLASKNRPEASLIDGLLKRRLFKRLWVVSRDMEQMRWDDIIRLWNNLPRHKRFEVAYEFEKLTAKQLAEKGAKTITEFPSEKTDSEVQLRIAQHTPWLLIDIPGTKPGADVGLYYVLEGQRRQLRKDERVSGVIQESDVWKQYARGLLNLPARFECFAIQRFQIQLKLPLTGNRALNNS